MTEEHEPTNEAIARTLEEIAELLEAGDNNLFRVNAYRKGAVSVRASERPGGSSAN